MMERRKVTIGLILIVCSFALCSAARCSGKPKMLNRGTQTPRLWLKRNPQRIWHDYISPMALWFRPDFWNKAFGHIDIMDAPLPMSTHPAFPDQWDQIFDTFMEDPWGLIDFAEGHDQVHSLEEESHEPIMETDEHNSFTGKQEEEQYYPVDESEYAQQYDRETSYPTFRDDHVQIQQNERNTRYRNSQDGNHLKNHEHRLRRQSRVKSDDYENNMGSYPSNQQPTNNMRNHRNTQERPDIREDNGRFTKYNEYDHHNNEHNRDSEQNRNTRNRNQRTLVKNRQNWRRDPHEVHLKNQVGNRPVEIYSLQVPGYRPAELHVRTEGRKVRVQGKQQCGCQDTCTIREFERVTTLPENIDTRNLQALVNKEGTLSIQAKQNNKLSHGRYEDRDILVEGLDLPPIEDSSKNTENCVKKATLKLAKIDGRTGKRVPITTQHDPVPQRTFENEYEEDGVTIEVVEE